MAGSGAGVEAEALARRGLLIARNGFGNESVMAAWGLLRALEDEGPDYELAVTGQRFRITPPAFSEIERAFGHRLVQFGYLETRRAYHAILRGADIVVATALHEFQGLAVLEAVAAGCLPAVPARQAYPEIYPEAFRYASHPGDPAAEALAAAALIRRLAADLAALAFAAGADVLFAPDLSEMYPGEPLASVLVDRVTDHMEGLRRPGHFEGVATVVAKLLAARFALKGRSERHEQDHHHRPYQGGLELLVQSEQLSSADQHRQRRESKE